VRKMFNWAVDAEHVATSPATGIKPRGKAVRRDRVLAAAEVRTIWNALPDASLSEATRNVIRLLFLTGQRSGEVCGMTRGEIDVDRRSWNLPGRRTKNGEPHVVPLSDAAFEIVERALHDANEEPDAALFTRIGGP